MKRLLSCCLPGRTAPPASSSSSNQRGGRQAQGQPCKCSSKSTCKTSRCACKSGGRQCSVRCPCDPAKCSRRQAAPHQAAPDMPRPTPSRVGPSHPVPIPPPVASGEELWTGAGAVSRASRLLRVVTWNAPSVGPQDLLAALEGALRADVACIQEVSKTNFLALQTIGPSFGWVIGHTDASLFAKAKLNVILVRPTRRAAAGAGAPTTLRVLTSFTWGSSSAPGLKGPTPSYTREPSGWSYPPVTMALEMAGRALLVTTFHTPGASAAKADCAAELLALINLAADDSKLMHTVRVNVSTLPRKRARFFLGDGNLNLPAAADRKQFLATVGAAKMELVWPAETTPAGEDPDFGFMDSKLHRRVSWRVAFGLPAGGGGAADHHPILAEVLMKK